ncbi:response regulator transcription factor [Catenovulum sp. 2E275]|uniref:response regulator transcription factor n=1 Tax=Catenovulum sp. 2E275 TaxID=2980497 RepID=UPI0021CE559C|nr:response regulator transcription factor [Catenovulum sp. 2E275]MCU4674478.1 response regulator transcription factor [Catenovulum sp. 2E275]
MNKQILIIEDDLSLSELLAEYLSTDGLICDTAETGLIGIDKLKQQNIDLILLDVMLPGIDGFETLKRIRQFSKTPVLMLTARGDDFDRILGLELGADDYLPKPFNHRELLARIKAILRRFEYANEQNNQSYSQLGKVTIDHNSHSVQLDHQEIELTGTEYQFLVYLFKHLGQLISKEALSKEILGRDLMQFDRSIDMHISNLRKKLKGDPNIQIKTVRGAGYRLLIETE